MVDHQMQLEAIEPASRAFASCSVTSDNPRIHRVVAHRQGRGVDNGNARALAFERLEQRRQRHGASEQQRHASLIAGQMRELPPKKGMDVGQIEGLELPITRLPTRRFPADSTACAGRWRSALSSTRVQTPCKNRQSDKINQLNCP